MNGLLFSTYCLTFTHQLGSCYADDLIQFIHCRFLTRAKCYGKITVKHHGQ